MSPITVAGAGPLGAATAYHLARSGLPVTVVSDAGSTDAAYRNSGGSICWYRRDPRRSVMIRETADFVLNAVAAGARIGCREVPYVFLSDGVQAPALNINTADLVAYLLAEAERAGAHMRDIGRIVAVDENDGRYRVRGERGESSAPVVVLALGAANRVFMPGLTGAWEKRQLFVTDLPVDEHRARWPHTIAGIRDGFAYVFVKELDGQLRVLVGQEDLVDDDNPRGPSDHFAELLEAGVAEHFPFLRHARVKEILWGLDWEGKLPHLAGETGLVSINCGSGVRVCIAAGRVAAQAAIAAMDAPG